MIFRFDDVDRALDALQKGGLNVLAPFELYHRTEK